MIGILKRAEAGQPVTELCRELGITQQTFYRWRRKYGGMEVSSAQEPKPAARRESATQAPGGGAGARQPDSQGFARKKSDSARCAASERAASPDAAAGQPASRLPGAGLFTGRSAV
ncbi:MAG: transposase [Myxococcales bacterium]|nr:transposase [Myxococcales bacterium]